MKPYARILTIIDFDQQGEQVARRALHLAQLDQARLIFLHLAEADTAMDGGYPAASAKDYAQSIESVSLRRLKFLAAQLGADASVECQARCGPMRQTFHETVRDWQPDLVVSAREFSFLPGAHDLLILGKRHPSRGGKLLRNLANCFSASFRTATPY